MTELSASRRLACKVGAAARMRDGYAADILDADPLFGKLDTPDRAFAHLLVCGVASTVGTLDQVIDRCLDSPRDIKDDVRDALRVSTYEILFLKKARHAAVDQGVELVRSVAPRAAGLGNAVLRRIVRAAEDFPFGDPATDDDALARSLGFPRWLADELIAVFGRSAAADFMAACNEPAPLYIAVNACKATDADVRAEFERHGVKIAPVVMDATHEIAGCFLLEQREAIGAPWVRKLFSAGKILVSDAAAQYVAELALPPTRPASYLEVGSGRATKTVLLQSLAMGTYGEQMALSAMDVHAFKMDILKERCDRYGVKVAECLVADARAMRAVLDERAFDGVFIDAPCSGVGTLRRHPEIRWKLKPDDIGELADTGLAMLQQAALHTALGGRITYATCTVFPRENEQVIKRFLESDTGRGFRIVDLSDRGSGALFYRSQLHDGGCDAHFAATLIRVAAQE